MGYHYRRKQTNKTNTKVHSLNGRFRPARRGRRRRGLWGAVLAIFGLLLLLALGLSIVSWWVPKWGVGRMVRGLAELERRTGWHLSLSDCELSAMGELRLKGIALRNRADWNADPFAHISSLTFKTDPWFWLPLRSSGSEVLVGKITLGIGNSSQDKSVSGLALVQPQELLSSLRRLAMPGLSPTGEGSGGGLGRRIVNRIVGSVPRRVTVEGVELVLGGGGDAWKVGDGVDVTGRRMVLSPLEMVRGPSGRAVGMANLAGPQGAAKISFALEAARGGGGPLLVVESADGEPLVVPRSLLGEGNSAEVGAVLLRSAGVSVHALRMVLGDVPIPSLSSPKEPQESPLRGVADLYFPTINVEKTAQGPGMQLVNPQMVMQSHRVDPLPPKGGDVDGDGDQGRPDHHVDVEQVPVQPLNDLWAIGGLSGSLALEVIDGTVTLANYQWGQEPKILAINGLAGKIGQDGTVALTWEPGAVAALPAGRLVVTGSLGLDGEGIDLLAQLEDLDLAALVRSVVRPRGDSTRGDKSEKHGWLAGRVDGGVSFRSVSNLSRYDALSKERGSEEPGKIDAVPSLFWPDPIREEQIRGRGKLNISGLDVRLDSISSQPVVLPQVAMDLDLFLHPREGKVRIRNMAAKKNGVNFASWGEVGGLGTGDDLGFDFTVAMGPVPCHDLSRSLPRGLMPMLADATFKGHTTLQVRFSGLLRDPDSIVLRVDGQEQGFVMVGGPDPERLQHPFEHVVVLPGGGQIILPLEPGEPNYAPYETISTHLRRAVITAEDIRFYHHEGFDMRQIERSLARNLEERRFARGGSTLTQQLAKNLYLSSEKSLSRKLQEAFLAWRMEEVLTKRRILEIYLNVIEWAPGIYGITQAAEYYFQKSPGEISVPEALLLAAIIPDPKSYALRLARNGKPDQALQRRMQVILERMAYLDWIGPNLAAAAAGAIPWVRVAGPPR